jgi:integrase
MRPSDILRLRLDDIHWRERSIVYCQSKTGKPITLPLLPEISEALIDYLRSWRPPTKSRCIFVRHKVPFEPFASKDPLYWIMPEALRRAGIFKRPGSRGLYLFRHTLAARLLGAHVSIKTIGDILGHASAQSTFVYTKVDVSALRSASLSITEVLQ